MHELFKIVGATVPVN